MDPALSDSRLEIRAKRIIFHVSIRSSVRYIGFQKLLNLYLSRVPILFSDLHVLKLEVHLERRMLQSNIPRKICVIKLPCCKFSIYWVGVNTKFNVFYVLYVCAHNENIYMYMYMQNVNRTRWTVPSFEYLSVSVQKSSLKNRSMHF